MLVYRLSGYVWCSFHDNIPVNLFNLQMDLVKTGHVYLGEHSGWYSVSDECFYTDSQIRTETKQGSEVKVSIETGNVVEWTKEENYKFSLSKFKVPLLNHFKANPDGEYY